jgi:hypothetical protein
MNHGMKDVQITLVISITDVAALVKVGRENVSVFVNGSILNDGFIAVADLVYLIKPTVQEIDLQVKSPTRHVGIEILEVRIVVYGFIQGCPSVVPGQSFGEGGFSGTDIAGYGDVSEGRIHGFNLGNWIAQRPKNGTQILRNSRSSPL